MLQLVYTSNAMGAIGPEQASELCRQAAANNKLVEITGILAIKGSRFLQVLEGPKIALEDTFIRIIRDPRHRDVTLLSRRIITGREFGEWSMALCDDLTGADAISRRIACLTAAAPEHIQRAFTDFVAGHTAPHC